MLSVEYMPGDPGGYDLSPDVYCICVGSPGRGRALMLY